MSVRRDYKSPNTWRGGSAARRVQARRNAVLVGLLLVIGVVGGVVAWLGERPRTGPLQPTPALTTPSPAAPSTGRGQAAQSEALPPAAKPKYDFYKVLPERQVVVGEEPAATPMPRLQAMPPAGVGQQAAVTPPAGTAAPAKPGGGRYLLQVGAFSNYAEADRVKASLALLGVNARIEVGKASDGSPLNRVRIGPLKDSQQMQALRKRLQEHNFPSVPIALD
ncbi:MAG TPA: SPOR domain-containing protein [Candidatus Competibacteraceae bacterium]|nr:SPOR domain-containing protein [Candidatus Competibacteraceae bacterium]